MLEIAILDIREGLSPTFEIAFRQAQRIIASAPGHERHELRRCIERENRYVLLVWWDSLASHTVGFRGSPQYQEWRALLHHFYDPFPQVEHYESIAELAG